ncbi:MAG: SEC-C metal-binding domain-containing protein [Rubrivivax sp.]
MSVPSLDVPRDGGGPVQLPGTWLAAAPAVEGAAKAAPAIVLLHGCGGLFERGERRRGSGAEAAPELAPRYTELAAHLNALGIHVLVTDSLTPRGERELHAAHRPAPRDGQPSRRRDALGALAWLAAQPGVDGARIGLLGWSNGGSTVLAATNLAHPEVAKAAVRPSLAVAYYPGCEAEAQRGYRPSAALLMLLGEVDDWTAAAPCKAMAAAAVNAAPAPAPPWPNAAPVPAPQWQSYEGAYHGFDGTAPVRLRRDVPNGVHPGQGVHVGADPAARRRRASGSTASCAKPGSSRHDPRQHRGGTASPQQRSRARRVRGRVHAPGRLRPHADAVPRRRLAHRVRLRAGAAAGRDLAAALGRRRVRPRLRRPARPRAGAGGAAKRLDVLHDELDAEALLAGPDVLRLDPYFDEWDDVDRQRLVEENGMSAEDAAAMQPGVLWAGGVLAGLGDAVAVAACPRATTSSTRSGRTSSATSKRWWWSPAATTSARWPKCAAPKRRCRATRCWRTPAALQDLRVFLLDHGPKPEQRRVEAPPGRNDPCPCGSGRKYKKCHGAA